MEDLAYLHWMRGRIERVTEIMVDKVERAAEMMVDEMEYEITIDNYDVRGPQGLIPRFVRAFEKSYRNTVEQARILATECGTQPHSLRKAMYDQLLSCCDNSPAGIESRKSILSQAVQFYEATGDYLMAQKSQELYLSLLAQASGSSSANQGVLGAIQKLIDLYEKVSERMGFIAERLGLNVPVALTVWPVLHRAIRQNNLLLVSETIDRVDKSNDIDILGRDALHCACETRALPILQFLIQKGYHLNQDDFVLTTPLCLAAEVGFLDGVTHLLRADLSDAWNRNDINHPRWRVLREAVENGHLKLGDLRINAAIASSSERRPERWGKALVVAARGGHLEIVTWIVEMGINMNIEFTLDAIAEGICVAAAGGHLGVFQLLVEHGVGHNLNVKGSVRFQAPLYHAAKGGNLRIVEWLIQRGENVDLPAPNGSTALQVAAEKGHVEILEELILRGANINARPGMIADSTALEAAIGGRHLAIARSLIERGADVHAEFTTGRWTALHAAAEHGDLQFLELLIENVAKDFQWYSAPGILYAAAKGGHWEVVRRLLALGAVDSAPEAQYSALGAAAEQGNLMLVKLLVENEGPLDCGAPTNASSGLWVEAQRGQIEIAQFLIQNNIAINCYPRKYVGEIALHAAASTGRLAMVESLIKIGANVDAYSAN